MPPKFSYASALSQPKPAPSPLLRTQPPSTPSTHAPSSSSPARADRDTSRSDLSRGSPKRVQPKPPAKSSPKPPPKTSVANVDPSPKPERPSAGGQGEGPKTPAPQLPSPKAPAASDTAGGEGEPKPKKKKKKAVQLPPAPPPVFVEDDFPSLSRDTGPKRPPKRMPAPIAHSPSTEDAAVYPVSLDRAAATSGSEGDSDWPRVETAPKYDGGPPSVQTVRISSHDLLPRFFGALSLHSRQKRPIKAVRTPSPADCKMPVFRSCS